MTKFRVVQKTEMPAQARDVLLWLLSATQLIGRFAETLLVAYTEFISGASLDRAFMRSSSRGFVQFALKR